jgi:DNA-binding IclR family transcriptional regulator
MVVDVLARWRDVVGAPVYYAVYREGEIDVVCVSDTPGSPAVEEWADFRETGHAHAIGQCLLAQLDEEARRDHLARHPAQPVTPYTVRDGQSLLKRLEQMSLSEPVTEHQQYTLGTVCACPVSRKSAHSSTVCAAIPITVGSMAATVAISLPVQHADRLLPAAHRLQGEVTRLLGSLGISISI